ncbi:MAG: hypothetical protein QOC55_1657 [Thermoleophilaceae bacterium]|jgi:hypothetical protein|nr:hypothetical protein [Thermoleophilaceae bacterium]
MRFRIGFTALIASLALAAIGVPTAGAASTNSASPQVTDAGPLMTIPMSGVAKNGKKFTGTYGIYKFTVKNGKVWSVGTLKGRLNGRHVTRANVMLPATLTGDNGAQTAASCTVLHLVLGPINLNLLGLHVTLGGGAQANQPIVLDITAQQGGGLLGDLLCGITNALDPNTLGQLGTQLQQLAATLNSIAGLLGGL